MILFRILGAQQRLCLHREYIVRLQYSMTEFMLLAAKFQVYHSKTKLQTDLTDQQGNDPIGLSFSGEVIAGVLVAGVTVVAAGVTVYHFKHAPVKAAKSS